MKSNMEDTIHKRPHSTPKVHRGQGSDGQGDHGRDASVSLSLDETGESTRSLLSILSHSSIKDLPEDMLGNQSEDDDRASHSSSSSTPSSTKSKTSPRSSDSRSRSRSSSSSRSKSQTESYSKSSRYSLSKTTDTHSSSTSQTTSTKAPQLSPWEKWLIEKTKEERKRLKEKARLEREKQLKVAEERKMKAEKAKVIEVKVNMWIEERTAKEQEARKANLRLEKTKKKLEAEEKRRIEEKAKENYAEWKSKKKAEKELKEKKEKAEQKAKAEAERQRKEEAEDAYLKWKLEAKTRPLPLASNFGYPKGSLKGYHDKASYPIPSFYNPVPWMPIHTPQEHTKPPAKGQKRQGSRRTSGTGRQVQQPLSPPLLFRDRSERQKHGKLR